MELDDWCFTLEGLKWVLSTDNFQLFCVSLLDTFENEGEKFGQHIENFEVMFLDGHFHIETSEFAQMSVCIGIFSSEDWSNFKHAIEVTTESHLLVKLWALSEARWLVEIFECEYVGTTFRCTTDHFWGMDLNETVFHHEFSVKSAHSRLEFKDSLVCWDTQINDTVVESDILLDDWVFLAFLLLFLWTTETTFFFLVSNQSASIIDLERQNWS